MRTCMSYKSYSSSETNIRFWSYGESVVVIELIRALLSCFSFVCFAPTSEPSIYTIFPLLLSFSCRPQLQPFTTIKYHPPNSLSFRIYPIHQIQSTRSSTLWIQRFVQIQKSFPKNKNRQIWIFKWKHKKSSWRRSSKRSMFFYHFTKVNLLFLFVFFFCWEKKRDAFQFMYCDVDK